MDANQYQAIKEILEMFGIKDPVVGECMMLKNAIEAWRSKNTIKTEMEAIVHSGYDISNCVRTIEDTVAKIELMRIEMS